MSTRWTDADLMAHQARMGRKDFSVPTEPAPAVKPSKYRNVKVSTPDGIFDSKREHAHWLKLKGLQAVGEITELERQIAWPLFAPSRKDGGPHECIGEYRCDFQYRDKSGTLHVEDVKGMKSLPLYRWKVKHLEAQDGITVTEIR